MPRGRRHMEILPATFLDLNALSKLERACFGEDAWPFLDLIAVLTFADVVRLKAVEDGEMIGFAAGDPRPAEGFSWIATIGVAPEFRRRGIGRELAARLRGAAQARRGCGSPCVLSNEGAIRLYRAGGLRQDGCLAELLQGRRGCHRDGEDPGVIMSDVCMQNGQDL